jgi:hypothetical protein
MNSFIQRLLAPFSARWSKTRSTLAARGGDAGKRAFDALQELRDSETGKRAASALADLRQRDPVRKAEEAARRTLHDLRSGGGPGDSSGAS